MTTDPAVEVDPFADAMILRDGYKRPMIVPPEGGKAVPYTRASTFADALDNGSGLTYWKVQHVALGIARHEDLAAQAAGLRYKDRKLAELCDTALERASDKAAWGSACHSFTDPDPSPFVPERMAADVDSYHAKLAELGITQVDSERFVVCDELQVAGTFDGTYDVPTDLLADAGLDIPRGGIARLVGDKKTGSIHAQAVGIQVATYSRGKAYSVGVDDVPIREDLDVRQDVGLLIHIPKGEGRTDIYLIDLAAGWADAKLAVAVREANARKDILRPLALPGAAVDQCSATRSLTGPRCSKVWQHGGRHAYPKGESAVPAPVAADGTVAGLYGESTTGESLQRGLEDGAAGRVTKVTDADLDAWAENRTGGVETEVTKATRDEVLAAAAAMPPPGPPVIPPELAVPTDSTVAGLDDDWADTAPADFVIPTVAMPIPDCIAGALTVDHLVALYAETGAVWTDDDKALATARRNLLTGGIVTTSIGATA